MSQQYMLEQTANLCCDCCTLLFALPGNLTPRPLLLLLLLPQFLLGLLPLLLCGCSRLCLPPLLHLRTHVL